MSYEYYGIYRRVRNSAWHCLIDFKVNRLPIDVVGIARSAKIHVVKNSLVNDLEAGERAKTYNDAGRWTIIYDDRLSTEQARYILAHELGHIFLGHELQHAKYVGKQEVKQTPAAEKHASAFAVRLLCPACVLWRMNLHTADEIARYCRIEPALAAARAKRMKELYERNKFLTDETEQDLDKQFQDYIQENAPVLTEAKN